MVSVLLTVGRAAVLSSRAIASGELEELLRLLEPFRKELESRESLVIMGWPAPLAAIR